MVGVWVVNIVIATNSFKGTLTSSEAGRAMADGIRRVLPGAHVVVVPVADGGEGTTGALLHACGGRRHSVRVDGPLGDPVEAELALLGDGGRAVIEMAAASGLPLVPPDRRNPLRASTYGTGQLIIAALEIGCREILVGAGGSATVDGGCGAAQALGVRFLAADGRVIDPPMGGERLGDVQRIDLTHRDPRIRETTVTVLCDVNNPLCGPNGAARVFGPQKGADAEQVESLERNLTHLADVVRRDVGVDLRNMPGAGAAGGLAGGLAAFAGARLTPGADAILDLVRFDDCLHGADLVITGEGRLDAQSMMGKLVGVVAARARAARVPTLVIAGSVGPGADLCLALVESYHAVLDQSQASVPTAAEAAALLIHRTAQVLAERARGR